MRATDRPERTLCCWCPDWPVVTARRNAPDLAGVPVAVAATEGGSRGLVVRAASAEARAFESVARATEVITPRIVLERPGLLAFPTRGPSRYFGGDAGLAARVPA